MTKILPALDKDQREKSLRLKQWKAPHADQNNLTILFVVVSYVVKNVFCDGFIAKKKKQKVSKP